MFAGRSSLRRFGLAALLGTVPLSLGACGLLIGLEDHQPFPTEGVDAGEDVDNRGVRGRQRDMRCRLRRGGVVLGLNDHRQLGRNTTAGNDPDPTPGMVQGLPPTAQVSVGSEFACARLSDGSKIYCWGNNLSGALGNGLPVTTDNVAPGAAAFTPSGGLLDISTGLGDHACALDGANGVWCWGSDRLGQLGHNPMLSSGACLSGKCTSMPYLVPALTATEGRIWSAFDTTCADR